MDVYELLKNDHFASHLGIELKEAVDGKAVCTLSTNSSHLNGGNLVHGGVLFTLCDYTLAAAANSHGRLAISLEGNIHYMKSVEVDDRLLAEAKEMHLGKRVSHYLVNVYNSNNELVASMTGIAYYVGNED